MKNTAGWWADDKISEGEFVNAIQYLVKVGIIIIETNENEKHSNQNPIEFLNDFVVFKTNSNS